MRRLLILSSLIIVVFTLTSCNYVEEQKAKRLIRNYYSSLKDETYEQMFNQLWIFDNSKHFTSGTNLTKEEALEFYLNKIKALKEASYKLKDFEIIKVEYEDGHSFWHHLLLTVEINKETYEWKETVYMWNERLLIGNSGDPYVLHRDGGFDIDKK